ncbi:hypothetical protein B6V75_18020 [Thioclava sp. F1Mire-8]|nr:hypothetical protein B6V75_18020 [Thioclava sp. F1Mire-8]
MPPHLTQPFFSTRLRPLGLEYQTFRKDDAGHTGESKLLTSSSVVILEDDADVRTVIERAIASEGYPSKSFGTLGALFAGDALTRADCFLVDITLPDGSGFDVLRAIRSKNPGAGIIVLSGRTDEIDTVLGLELGADDYVCKPFRARELRARVKAVLRRTADRKFAQKAAQDSPADVFEISGLRFNRRARWVRPLQDVKIPLTTLEYDVLLALATQPDTVLSRDQIMDRVRGPDWAAFDRTVDGVISRIRSKLEKADVSHGAIKTIRNVGYVFTSET